MVEVSDVVESLVLSDVEDESVEDDESVVDESVEDDASVDVCSGEDELADGDVESGVVLLSVLLVEPGAVVSVASVDELLSVLDLELDFSVDDDASVDDEDSVDDDESVDDEESVDDDSVEDDDSVFSDVEEDQSVLLLSHVLDEKSVVLSVEPDPSNTLKARTN